MLVKVVANIIAQKVAQKIAIISVLGGVRMGVLKDVQYLVKDPVAQGVPFHVSRRLLQNNQSNGM